MESTNRMTFQYIIKARHERDDQDQYVAYVRQWDDARVIVDALRTEWKSDGWDYYVYDSYKKEELNV